MTYSFADIKRTALLVADFEARVMARPFMQALSTDARRLLLEQFIRSALDAETTADGGGEP
jgi:hypothetical protein